ncbi:unnamed protein product [Protopolystoma xenopodis]|uniref:UPF0506 domain-containing protein n=1 Tax=Protopolystoma xenopodis TaxID=117903 RepID=A0A448WC32_9PLAT|nr:unnamed protein product [Protopolystoma xenopodis]
MRLSSRNNHSQNKSQNNPFSHQKADFQMRRHRSAAISRSAADLSCSRRAQNESFPRAVHIMRPIRARLCGFGLCLFLVFRLLECQSPALQPGLEADQSDCQPQCRIAAEECSRYLIHHRPCCRPLRCQLRPESAYNGVCVNCIEAENFCTNSLECCKGLKCMYNFCLDPG